MKGIPGSEVSLTLSRDAEKKKAATGATKATKTQATGRQDLPEIQPRLKAGRDQKEVNTPSRVMEILTCQLKM